MGRVETMKVDEVENLLSMHRLLRLKLQWIDIGASAMWRAKRRKKKLLSSMAHRPLTQSHYL